MTGKAKQLSDLADKVKGCILCTDLETSRTQTVFGDGNHDANLVFIGEAPGAKEDEDGVPFSERGTAGKRLTEIIEEEMKMKRKDVYICNILRCRPPKNRDPKADEANKCRQFLDKTLEIIKPKFICCLGTVASQNFLGEKGKPLQTREGDKVLRGVHKGKLVEGKFEEDKFAGEVTVVCTYHPTSRPKKKKQEEIKKDIRCLIKKMKNTEDLK